MTDIRFKETDSEASRCRNINFTEKTQMFQINNNLVLMNVAATYWHLLSFSLPSLQFEEKVTTIHILSFPRPFVRLGKVCKVWIWLHYCFLWLFRQWKVSKEIVFFLIFIALQNLLALNIDTIWYDFRSYVISTLIAVLFLPFGDQTFNEKQLRIIYWD